MQKFISCEIIQKMPQSAGFARARFGRACLIPWLGHSQRWHLVTELTSCLVGCQAAAPLLVICVCEICVQFFTLHFSLICQLATGSRSSSSSSRPGSQVPTPTKSDSSAVMRISRIRTVVACWFFFWERANTLQISQRWLREGRVVECRRG